jgi:APA family basic amino acid/polyamine antiporter
MSHGGKKLGTVALFSLASGTMISSGIFILPGLAYSQIGPLVGLSYLLAAVAALLSVFSLAELSTAMPKAGGDYFYITRSLGPGLGTIMGLLSWLALMLKTAFAIFGISEVLHLMTGLPLWAISIAITLIFYILNQLGTASAITVEIILVIGLLFIMLGYIIFGFFSFETGYFSTEFLPEIGEDPIVRLLMSSAAFVFVSFGGLLNISTVADEVKNPGKTIPKALFASIVSVGLIYVLMVVITTGLLPPADFGKSLTPIADAAQISAGNLGYIAILVASFLAFATTGNAGMLSASRYPMAMAQDGLLPEILGKRNKKEIPSAALNATALGIIIAVLFPLETLAKLASTVVLLTYIMINIAAIILRESKIRNYKPLFRIPGYPFTPIISLVLMGFFILELGVSSFEILLVIAGLGLMIYLIYGNKRAKYEYAALHLIRNMVHDRMQEAGLEEELREIIRSRDKVRQDLVDDLLEKALLIDLDHEETLHGVFQMVGSKLSSIIGLSSEELTIKLEERESLITTALNDFVSIPHVLLENQSETKMVLVRDKKGMYFDPAHPSIKAMIVLIGSSNQKEQHLKILAGLAHILQHDDFQRQWLEAESMLQLRDTLILMDRRRL